MKSILEYRIILFVYTFLKKIRSENTDEIREGHIWMAKRILPR